MHTPDYISYGIACAIIGAAALYLIQIASIYGRRWIANRQRRNHRQSILSRP